MKRRIILNSAIISKILYFFNTETDFSIEKKHHVLTLFIY